MIRFKCDRFFFAAHFKFPFELKFSLYNAVFSTHFSLIVLSFLDIAYFKVFAWLSVVKYLFPSIESPDCLGYSVFSVPNSEILIKILRNANDL